MISATAAAAYLGPASVLTQVDAIGRLDVLLSSGRQASARIALATPYRPVTGDEVLVIGNDLNEFYVIGVMRGAGPTTLTVPGDLVLEAPNGGITLSSAKGIDLRSRKVVETVAPRVVVRANRIDFFGKRLVQKFDNAYTWITELFQVKGRRIRSVADEGHMVKAGRMHIKTVENCSIDGKTIHLG
jgi:hypothetical protein